MMSPNTSKKKVRRKRKVNHKEDGLSNLPNEILTKILSCLKTKEAVRTGILSTRWKTIWASVPTLDLSQFDFKFKGKGSDYGRKAKARFSNFMNRVLVARKLPCLEKISIHGGNCDPYLIKSWMHAALERNVSELDVYFSRFSVDPPCELTHNLFSYNKLVLLKLCVDMTLYFLENSSCFPNLKVLELKGILYRDDDSLPNLLSSCPVLEDLAIIRSRWDNLGTLNITSRSLKRLILFSSFEDFEEPVDVEKMVIDAPAVESLDIVCATTKEYVVKDLSSLVDAKLDLCDVCNSSDTYNNHFKFLAAISNVKVLTLEPLTIDSLSFADFYNLPIFHNLTRLEIDGDIDNDTDFLEWIVMLEILKSSPVLEILILENIRFSPEESGQASESDVPSCLISHLKTIEINFNSYDNVEKVRYFLINAKVLEKMTIRSFYLDKSLKLDLCNVISESTRGSVTWSDEETVISFL